MKRNSAIENELTDLSPVVSGISNANIFRTPPGFFEELPAKVMSRLKAEEIEAAAGEEIGQISPLLASLRDRPTLAVPVDYFNNLPQSITAQLHDNAAEVPVIHLNRKNRGLWTRYAAAALVTGLIATGSLFLFNKQQGKEMDSGMSDKGDMAFISAGLPAIPDLDLANYLSSVSESSEWVSENSDSEFDDTGFFAMDDAAIKSMLKDIGYDVLQNYEEELTGNPSL